VRRTASGRVAEVSVGARTPGFEAFQRQLGWAVVRSNNFHVHAGARGVHLSGIGFGHGVGLCQTGAEERGRAGHSWQRILEFYYPGTGSAWRRAAGVRVEAIAKDEAAARELAAAGDAAAEEAERRSGLRLPDRVRLRTYPTIAAYRDATGAPGWMAATTRGRAVRLQPLGLLRSRGLLRSTVLHEMLHVAVDANASAQLPEWFIEGLVLSLAQEKPANRAYAAASRSVQSLIARHGREAVMRWLRSGLPADVAAAHRSLPELPR
jgi:stage II sporulation protein D